jgi:hypothetical protein
MDAHLPDDLSNLERRLAGWQPATADLHADRMLFAAGRASARRPTRFVWPALSGCLAVLAALLATSLASERAEKLALAKQMQQHSAPVLAETPSVPAAGGPMEPLAPTAYLSARRALEHDPDAWPAPAAAAAPDAAPPAPVLQAWRGSKLIDP